MANVKARIKRVLENTFEHFDAKGGFARDAARLSLGVVSTVRNSVMNRQLTTMRWSRRDQQWHHRWREGRINDDKRWRSAYDYATRGAYDIHDLLWRHYRPKTGDVVVDVGAGNGGETLFLAGMVGKTGRVVSLEAAQGPFSRLTAMCALNDWPQVEPKMVALAAEAGTVMMSDSENWVSGNMYEPGTAEVRAVALDDLCNDLGIDCIDWLKLNIEGAEKEAVLGMERMAPHVRHMTISCHDFKNTEWGRSKEVVTGWLVDHGFVVQEHGPGEPYERDYVYASKLHAS